MGLAGVVLVVLATGVDGLFGNALLLDEALESALLLSALLLAGFLGAALLVGRGFEALSRPVTLNGIGLNPPVLVGEVTVGLK